MNKQSRGRGGKKRETGGRHIKRWENKKATVKMESKIQRTKKRRKTEERIQFNKVKKT